MLQSIIRGGLCLMFGGLLLASSGCTTDRHTYISTEHSPKTLSLVDRVTEEAIWTADIPVGTKLVLDLDVKVGEDNLMLMKDGHPTRMRWWLHRNTQKKVFHEGYYSSAEALDQGIVDLPGVPTKMILSLRPTPEAQGQLRRGMLTRQLAGPAELPPLVDPDAPAPENDQDDEQDNQEDVPENAENQAGE